MATFLPAGSENNASVMMNCLLPLGALAAQGMGVLLVHHPRKGRARPARRPGAAARCQATWAS
jgi:hypothetical protein